MYDCIVCIANAKTKPKTKTKKKMKRRWKKKQNQQQQQQQQQTETDLWKPCDYVYRLYVHYVAMNKPTTVVGKCRRLPPKIKRYTYRLVWTSKHHAQKLKNEIARTHWRECDDSLINSYMDMRCCCCCFLTKHWHIL